MTATPASRPEVLDEHLHRAWQLLRRPYWPATLAETLCDPVRERLVRLYADQLARSACRVQTAVGPLRATARLRPPAQGVIDHKRAAAGDRDD
jgi:hypothetical protein